MWLKIHWENFLNQTINGFSSQIYSYAFEFFLNEPYRLTRHLAKVFAQINYIYTNFFSFQLFKFCSKDALKNVDDEPSILLFNIFLFPSMASTNQFLETKENFKFFHRAQLLARASANSCLSSCLRLILMDAILSYVVSSCKSFCFLC